ncbi:2Fe-2S iron-sulfur cluster-binding protein [Nocardioides sp. SOB77]|uniref:2Fe-2S iron-sulfur cluster-binding protein n=1 Tax=Nocardioides oceani TaxID=3058369 RepID=A0ABT8FBY8_9ACTN|nr:2Fe-2S iron-sulfur cluster-binding protein [Nocardioides oceani]MDN4172176.1 2Fe-2S iron-sulfur cluster-binding protein [Nocardioides oceani]
MATVRVVEVVRETADAHTLVLEPVDPPAGGRWDYRPGQFLTVRVPSDRPGGAARCYSLCSSPVRDERLKVTVKRTRDGYASNWLCDHVVAGHELEVLPPAGTFVPRSLDVDLLLLAGGSGITPVMSILTTALHAGTGRATLVYANRDESSVIFRDELVTLAAAHPDRLTVLHWLESVQGLPTEAGLRSVLAAHAADRDAFVCGPGAFMEVAARALTDLGVPRERVHQEVFTSLEGDPFAEVPVLATGADGVEGETSELVVELDGEVTTHAWPAGAKLLDVLLAAGVPAPYSCREGACSACACVLQEGTVELEYNEVLDQADLDDGIVLSCQARATSPVVKVSYDA